MQDWVIPLLTLLVGLIVGIGGSFVGWRQFRHKAPIESHDAVWQSFERQINAVEKAGNTEDAKRLRGEQAQHEESWRAQRGIVSTTASDDTPPGDAALKKSADGQQLGNIPDMPRASVPDTNGDPPKSARGKDPLESLAQEPRMSVPLDDVIFVPLLFAVPVKVLRGTIKHVQGFEPDSQVLTSFDLGASDFQSTNSRLFIVGLASLSPGQYRLRVEAENADGTTVAVEKELEIQISLVALALNPGWTLVSFPSRPRSSSIKEVFLGTTVTQVWSFNNLSQVWEFARMNDDGEWEGTLTQIIVGRAYFVRSTTFDPIKYEPQPFNPAETPPSYQLVKGWNAIGFTAAGEGFASPISSYLNSIEGKWGVCRWWNPAAQVYESAWPDGTVTSGFPAIEDGAPILESGKGYLLYLTEDAILVR